MRKGGISFLVFSALLISLASPSISAAARPASRQLTVYTVNYPLKYFAKRIAGEHAEVVLPVPPDQDPAFWQPDPKFISEYQRADLILLNGARYAKWVGKATLPQFRLINTSRKFRDQFIRDTEVVSHTHGGGDPHAHGVIAFTTWLDFSFASRQAKAIADALGRKRPKQRKMFQVNYAALERDLLGLDRKMKALASRRPGLPLVASHPVYQYMARRYGLNLKSAHWEHDQKPTPEQWAELQGILKDHPAKWMIWEGKPLPTVAAKLKSMGMQSVVFEPFANVPEKGDFLSVMRSNLANLGVVFRPKTLKPKLDERKNTANP